MLASKDVVRNRNAKPLVMSLLLISLMASTDSHAFAGTCQKVVVIDPER